VCVQKTQEEWRNVFYVCGELAILGSLAFGLFAETNEQEWAKTAHNPTVLNMEFTLPIPEHNGEDTGGNGQSQGNDIAGKSEIVRKYGDGGHVTGNGEVLKENGGDSSVTESESRAEEDDVVNNARVKVIYVKEVSGGGNGGGGGVENRAYDDQGDSSYRDVKV
jgi:hypothetical protein